MPESSGRCAAGPAVDLQPGTLVEIYLQGLREHPPEDTLLRRTPAGEWEAVSRRQFGDRVRLLALGLRELGYERGHRVAILSNTRMEWAQADYALVMSGLVSVPVYPSLPPDQVLEILRDSGARAVFAEDEKQVAKIREIAPSLERLDRVFTMEPVDGGVDGAETLHVDELAERGSSVDESVAETYESFARRTEPSQLASLIYTSGTTGEPKGVMLTHDNFHSNVLLSRRMLPVLEEDVYLSWLPLSHVFERTAGHYIMWHGGVTLAYAESHETVARDMREVRPTVMAGIPRLYEKLQARAAAAAREAGALTWRVFRWATDVGRRVVNLEQDGEEPGPWLRLQRALADRLVFRKLRNRVGGRIRTFVSGGGPLSTDVARFLLGAGLPVVEGYGLTETSPVLTINPPDANRIGTVGPPIPNTEILIADDGEILVRGPQVMKGYFGCEDATRATFTEDGWLKTGDIGELDDDGYLRITDRKKEIIVTSGGKNIAPSPIEKMIERSTYVEHAVMIGDRRRFPMVVIVPDVRAVRSWCEEQGIEVGTGEAPDLVSRPEVVELLEGEALDRSEAFAHYEQPKKVLVVPGPFTVAGGELTPTAKVKRRVVAERYAAEIEEIYRRAEEEQEAGEAGAEGAEGAPPDAAATRRPTGAAGRDTE